MKKGANAYITTAFWKIVSSRISSRTKSFRESSNSWLNWKTVEHILSTWDQVTWHQVIKIQTNQATILAKITKPTSSNTKHCKIAAHERNEYFWSHYMGKHPFKSPQEKWSPHQIHLWHLAAGHKTFKPQSWRWARVMVAIAQQWAQTEAMERKKLQSFGMKNSGWYVSLRWER